MPDVPAPVPVTLTISLDPRTGDVSLRGPVKDRMLCYALLGMANAALVRAGDAPVREAEPVLSTPPRMGLVT